MATMPAPSVVRTMNYALQDARTKKIDDSLNKSSKTMSRPAIHYQISDGTTTAKKIMRNNEGRIGSY